MGGRGEEAEAHRARNPREAQQTVRQGEEAEALPDQDSIEARQRGVHGEEAEAHRARNPREVQQTAEAHRAQQMERQGEEAEALQTRCPIEVTPQPIELNTCTSIRDLQYQEMLTWFLMLFLFIRCLPSTALHGLCHCFGQKAIRVHRSGHTGDPPSILTTEYFSIKQG